MTEQYLRKVSLVVETSDQALDLSDLRITFETHQHDLQTPNSCLIRVYNLSTDTAQRIQKEFTTVTLQAGYDVADFGIVFHGNIIQVRRGRENATDTYCDILAADGDAAYNFSAVNVTLAAGATQSDIADVLKRGLSDDGVEAGYSPDLADTPALPRGKVMYGMTRDHMRVLADNTDTAWSIQDGLVQLVPNGGYVPGDTVVLNSKTGMIGLPEQTENGISVRCLLNPKIKVGTRVQIDNKSIQGAIISLDYTAINYFPRVADDGIYKVLLITHSGDTRGDEWYSLMICIALGDPISVGLANRGIEDVQ